MYRHLLAVVAAVGLVTACADDATAPPQDAPLGHRSHHEDRRVTALTQNLYVGADVDQVIAALASPDPSDDVPALLAAIQVVSETDFPARAAAIAESIRRTRPHVVGLQEVTQLDIDLTPLMVPIVIHQDFLAILGVELAARGLNYRVAVTTQNTTAQPIPGIGFVDFDAILVDADRVQVTATANGTFAHNIGVVAPGVEIKRGWTVARVRIQGVPYTFINTHLESGDAPGLAELRAAQASELTALVTGPAPTLLLGDLNDVPGSPMYHVLRQAGFRDSWAALRRDAGFTCCQAANLANDVSALDRRIDYVMVRPSSHLRRLEGATWRLGAHPAERIAGPAHSIWPSDHAGVVLRIE